LCQPCLRDGRTSVGTQVDHIVPKSQGGSDDDGNLQCICSECHRVKSSRESKGPA
jgi:5-methylcytosine-specific restriction protein A